MKSMSDPKPIFDYFRNMLLCGVFISSGYFFHSSDAWPVHKYFAVLSMIIGGTLYVINGLWGYHAISSYFDAKSKQAKIIFLLFYVLFSTLMADFLLYVNEKL